MKKHLLPHILIVSFVFLQTPTIQAAPDVEGRIKLYKHAIRIDPDDAEAHYGLGATYLILEMYKEAIDALRQAIKLDPDNDAMAHCALGFSYQNLGKWKKAIESYKQAIRIDPDVAETHFNLGVAYGDLGKYEEAIESYKQAIRIDPNLAVVHYNLGLAYYASGMLRETVAANKQAIRLDPDFALAYANLGVAYVAIKDRDSAYEQYKILKRLDSELAKELFDKIDPLEILRYKR